MKKNILGGKSNSCPMCGGTAVYIYVKGLGVVSQCTTCNSCISGRAKDDIYIYSFTEEGNYAGVMERYQRL